MKEGTLINNENRITLESLSDSQIKEVLSDWKKNRVFLLEDLELYVSFEQAMKLKLHNHENFEKYSRGSGEQKRPIFKEGYHFVVSCLKKPFQNYHSFNID